MLEEEVAKKRVILSYCAPTKHTSYDGIPKQCNEPHRDQGICIEICIAKCLPLSAAAEYSTFNNITVMKQSVMNKHMDEYMFIVHLVNRISFTKIHCCNLHLSDHNSCIYHVSHRQNRCPSCRVSNPLLRQCVNSTEKCVGNICSPLYSTLFRRIDRPSVSTDAWYGPWCRTADLEERLASDHVLRTCPSKLRASFKQLYRFGEAPAARLEGADEHIDVGADAGHPPSDEEQNEEPDNHPNNLHVWWK